MLQFAKPPLHVLRLQAAHIEVDVTALVLGWSLCCVAHVHWVPVRTAALCLALSLSTETAQHHRQPGKSNHSYHMWEEGELTVSGDVKQLDRNPGKASDPKAIPTHSALLMK